MIRKINLKRYLVFSCEELEKSRAYLEMHSDKLSSYKKNALESRIADLVDRIENLKKEIEND